MLTVDQKKLVAPFLQHGVDIDKQRGDQLVGTCPFTDKPERFHVKADGSFLWDSKSAGYSGNLYEFLRRISEQNEEDITAAQLRRLAVGRNLPVNAFRGWGIGHNGTSYTLPMFNEKGTCVDVRMYNPKGGRCISTSSGSASIINLPQLLSSDRDLPVYLCEGEWDTIAMQWLLGRIKSKGVAVGVTGAATFKDPWVEYFKGREVFLLYDNDEAGREGERKVFEKLSGESYLKCLHWDEECPEEFDVRDLIIKYVEKQNFTGAYRYIKRHSMDAPRLAPRMAVDKKRESSYTESCSIDEVRRVFKKWLYLRDTNGIEISLAVLVSQVIEGDPVWLFLVAAPGGSKTETIQAFDEYEHTLMLSSLTPRALLSGAQGMNGSDPSLLPKLDGKTLLIKDFTSVINMHANERDEIFGILRDAYDGKASRTFGNGITRVFKGRFSILAGVTPVIYALGATQSALGERFLKFRVGKNLEHDFEEQIIHKAISNTGHETEMREELQDACSSFLTRNWEDQKMPRVPDRYIEGINYLARFGAALRGVVSRDKYKAEIITAAPSTEVGSRFAKQLAKLGLALCLVQEKEIMDYAAFRLLKRVTLDSVDQRIEDIVRVLSMECQDQDDTMSARQIAGIIRYPVMTVTRLLNDLNSLRVVQCPTLTRGQTGKWQLTDRIKELIIGAKLYHSEVEREREFTTTEEGDEGRPKIKVRRKRRVSQPA